MFELVPSLYMRSLFEDLNFELSDFNKANYISEKNEKIDEISESNLGKMIPFVGAAINGGFDLVETKLTANRAYKMFIEGDLTVGDDIEVKDDGIEVVEGEFTEVK